MDISIILPTRGRYEPLRRSIASLMDTATDPSSIEVLLALDDDDGETIRRITEEGLDGALGNPGRYADSADSAPEAPSPKLAESARLKLFIGPRLGYVNLHVYVNRLCAEASGEWLFLWNDDVLMQTVGWDEIVRSFTGRFLLLNLESNHGNQVLGDCPFPILPRRWFEVLDHIARSNHYDTWVQFVSRGLGIKQDIPVFVLHDRFDMTGSNDDATARERVFTTNTFYGPETQRKILADVERIREFLAKG